MTLGIEEIGVCIPETRISNLSRMETFGIDRKFLDEKIGVRAVAVKAPGQEPSDLCVSAFAALTAKRAVDLAALDALIVVTQNPDTNLPHTSAIVHGKLGLPERCACFDVSLGCSGYVYALSVLGAFLESNGFRRGLLCTADPYSKIVQSGDRDTALLFGDAATVSLIGHAPVLRPGAFSFGTIGARWQDLVCRDGRLRMNGRRIFEFAATYIPRDVREVLRRNELGLDDIDLFVFHQGSKFIVDTIASRLQLPPEKVVFHIAEYGNTVSSSLPIALEPWLSRRDVRRILLSGFGVGLSWASVVLFRG